MKKSILLLSGLVLWNICVFGQEIDTIYTEEFDGGLGDWIAGEGMPVGAVWQWAPDSSPDSAMLDGEFVGSRLPTGFPMESLTPENGSALFNSDVYNSGGGEIGDGPFPGDQTATLTSPGIDCSGFDNVTLRFNQFLWAWNSENSTFLEVSNDGGTTWIDFPINTELNLVANTFTNDVQVLNISEAAANESNVQLRFTWSGDMAFWMLDDIHLIATPDNDLALESFFYTPGNYAQPEVMIGTDTFLFRGMIANKGMMNRNDVTFRASIINETRDLLVYQDSVVLETLEAFQDSLVEISMTYAPGDTLLEDDYSILYEVFSQDTMRDYNGFDNFEFADFQVTSDLYANEDGQRGRFFYSLLQPGAGGDYQMGNIFRASPNINEGECVATKASFSSFRQDAQGNSSLGGETVSVFLYELDEGLVPGVNFDNSPDTDDLTLRGFGDHTFDADYDFEDFVEVELSDIDNFSPGVTLTPGRFYFLTVSYEDGANDIFHVFDRDQKYRDFDDGISRLIFTFLTEDGWFYGFADDDRSLPRMRMQIDLSQKTTTSSEELLPENVFTINPNPVKDILNANVALEVESNGVLMVADAKGSILFTRDFENLTDGTFTFNMGNYPAGNYMLRLRTKDGSRTKQFTVTR